jgi:hypothetical protein
MSGAVAHPSERKAASNGAGLSSHQLKQAIPRRERQEGAGRAVLKSP